MNVLIPLVSLAAIAAASPAQAVDVIRLSPSQRDAAIAAAANGPERTAVLTPKPKQQTSVLDRSLYPEYEGGGNASAKDRKLHGEVSVFAGSGGLFGMSGTAVMPLGDNGMAAISVLQGSSRWGGVQGFNFGYASGNARNNTLIGGPFGGIGGRFVGFGGGALGFGDGALGYGDPINPIARRRR